MPYIKKEDRIVFDPHLNAILTDILCEPSDLVRAETAGYVASYLAFSAIGCSDGRMPERLKPHADEMLESIRSSDLFQLAGNINYCISYLVWGVLGDFSGFKKASYGMRCFIAQQVRSVAEMVKPECRLSCIVKGALYDMLDELYRRKTASYEDLKISENGDVFSTPALP